MSSEQNAGTLEWLPSNNYASHSIPIITSREPLWGQTNLAEDVDGGRYYLPNAPTAGHETIITSSSSPRPITDCQTQRWDSTSPRIPHA